MRNGIPALLMILIPLGIAPIPAIAAGCADYPLSQAQLDYVRTLDVAIPDGEVPIVQRCDANGDMVVDINDIRAITMNRNNGEPQVIYYIQNGQVARAFYGIDD